MEGRKGPERDKTAHGQCPRGGAGEGDARRSKGRSPEAVIRDEEEAREVAAETGCGAPGGGAGTHAEPSYSRCSGRGGHL